MNKIDMSKFKESMGKIKDYNTPENLRKAKKVSVFIVIGFGFILLITLSFMSLSFIYDHIWIVGGFGIGTIIGWNCRKHIDFITDKFKTVNNKVAELGIKMTDLIKS